MSVLGDNLIFRGSLYQSSSAETQSARGPYVAKENLLGCCRMAEDEWRFLTEALSVAVGKIDKRVLAIVPSEL